jgi:DNA (cytosine-5)-methyltransferase 1
LIGIRSDIKKRPDFLQKNNKKTTVFDVIGDLPRLRSKVNKQKDSDIEWLEIFKTNLSDLIGEISKEDSYSNLVKELKYHQHIKCIDGQPIIKKDEKSKLKFKNWFHDNKLKIVLNHEARGHMPTDLKRYLFAACFASVYLRSPRGHKEFAFKGLNPNHKNWKTGKFSDRFRVQLFNNPATTITSHISKDGHYFIHPDPSQCRSLTVREAARIQTFPDNYFFQGTRTQQFHQVGNAVPPLLALQIAKIVDAII